MSARCSYRRPNGDFCRRWAMRGSSFCNKHLPKAQPEPDLASSASRDLAFNGAVHPLSRLATLRDAFDVLRESVQAVRLGKISPGQAWAIAMLMDRWSRTREALRHQDFTLHQHAGCFGKRPAVNDPEHATYDDFQPPAPVITPQIAVNEAAALSPPDLYDPETGRRLVAPGIPLAPTIEELAFAAGPRAQELYPGVIPRPFVPTGDPMPYEALLLYRQASTNLKAQCSAGPVSVPGTGPSAPSVQSADSPLQPSDFPPPLPRKQVDLVAAHKALREQMGLPPESADDDRDDDLPPIPKATPAQARAVIRRINENTAAQAVAKPSNSQTLQPSNSDSNPSPLQPFTSSPSPAPGDIIVSTINRVAHRTAAKLLKRVAADLRARPNSNGNGHAKPNGPHGRARPDSIGANGAKSTRAP